ncbi:predicted metal-binding protein [Vibrio furnissii NCTC 11218]|nr:predicted metal-binding protein [Vibrio furnissii NCTC 11218]
MEKAGYHVNIHKQENWVSVKAPFNMPKQLASCHTALIDGYMIEGHVPEADIARLLIERPQDISGLSVPGMPRYSPGMAREDEEYQGFNIVAFDREGKLSLFNKY